MQTFPTKTRALGTPRKSCKENKKLPPHSFLRYIKHISFIFHRLFAQVNRYIVLVCHTTQPIYLQKKNVRSISSHQVYYLRFFLFIFSCHIWQSVLLPNKKKHFRVRQLNSILLLDEQVCSPLHYRGLSSVTTCVETQNSSKFAKFSKFCKNLKSLTYVNNKIKLFISF